MTDHVTDRAGATWRRHDYGIWKPESVPDGQRRIRACGWKTLDSLYGPLEPIQMDGGLK